MQAQAKFWATTQPHIMLMPKRLDSSTAPETERSARNFIQSGAQNLVFDCIELDYLTSVGLQAISTIAKLMHNVDGKLCVVNLHGQPKEIFEACHYEQIVPVRDEKEFESAAAA